MGRKSGGWRISDVPLFSFFFVVFSALHLERDKTNFFLKFCQCPKGCMITYYFILATLRGCYKCQKKVQWCFTVPSYSTWQVPLCWRWWGLFSRRKRKVSRRGSSCLCTASTGEEGKQRSRISCYRGKSFRLLFTRNFVVCVPQASLRRISYTSLPRSFTPFTKFRVTNSFLCSCCHQRQNACISVPYRLSTNLFISPFFLLKLTSRVTPSCFSFPFHFFPSLW